MMGSRSRCRPGSAADVMPVRFFLRTVWSLLACLPMTAWAQVQTLDRVDVTAPVVGLETATTANEGEVSRKQIEDRPAYRVGEVLEATPGLIVMSHSGEGKANQYFLRGFNLDPGTHPALSLDRLPIHLRTHS